jgi:hypothetical protein
MEQLARLKLRLDIPSQDFSKDNLLDDILETAKSKILNKRYPFGASKTELEARYLDLQVDLAIVLYNKMGVEGQTSHAENGVSRSYVDEADLLALVTPKIGVL